jgi:DNA-binding IclR family transcriptional regulator
MTVHSLETAGKILEVLHEVESARGADIHDELDVSRGTVYKHLHTLKQLGYVTKTNAVYSLSLRFLNLGKQVQRRHDLYEYGRPFVDSLAAHTGESVHLVCEENGWAYCLYHASGEKSIGNALLTGERTHLHHLASGKAILAFLPDERVDEIVDERGLPRFTSETVADRAELQDVRRNIRNRGYALNIEEEMEGIHAVGVPIRKADTLFGSLSVSGPAHRFDEQTMIRLLNALTYTQNMIELEFRSRSLR